MLENIKDLVRQYAGDSIINNPSIPNDRNEEAVADASHSIVSGLKGEVANGNVNGVVDLFKGGPEASQNSPVAQNIKSGFVQELVKKFGLDHGKAAGIAGSLIPAVLGKFVYKTNDPNDKSFDLQSIISNLTGGAGLNDIMGKLGGSNGTHQDGGMMDKVKGMFK